MMEAEVLEAVSEALVAALAAVDDVNVSIGAPDRPLARESEEIRVIVEDGGSPDYLGVDGAAAYVATVDVTVDTYRDGQTAAEVRALIQSAMGRLYLRSGGRHSGPWRTVGGWDIADAGTHRYAEATWSARVYSAPRILDRLGN